MRGRVAQSAERVCEQHETVVRIHSPAANCVSKTPPNGMSLTLRPTGLASPVDKDRRDYIVWSGDWAMGRIYEERGSPQHLRWYWSLHGILGKPLDMRTDGRAPTLEAAKAEFEASWRKWLAWARLGELNSE